MSTFTNITVSDTVTADTVVCDNLVTNSVLSATTYGGAITSTNSIIPYSGSNITLAANNNFDINTSNVDIAGNLIVNSKCFLAQSNAASQILMTTSGEQTFIDLYSHSNVANIFPDSRIFSIGGAANVSGSGTLYIGSRNCNFGPGLFTPTAGIGNLTITYNSSNIIGNVYCSKLVDITGNLSVSANLDVDRDANILGNLRVGNVIIGNQLTNTANINCANINTTFGGIVSGNMSIGNIISVGLVSSSGNVVAGNVIANYANLTTLFIGSSASYTQSTGTALVMSQNTTFDNTVTGTISGNVYPQYSFGSGREHVWSTDVGNANISYYGISDGTAPDSDYFITYKRAVGMKISPIPTSTDFTEALRVVGTSNISGDALFVSNVNITGNLAVSTAANIISLTGSGNTIVGYNALNRKIRIGAIDATTQRLTFYGSSNVTAENVNGYIEIDGASNGATTQNQGVLNMVAGNITMGTVNSQSFILYNKNVEIQGNINALTKLTVSGNTSVTNLNYTDLFNTNVRIGNAWGAITLATPTIANGAYVPFGATVYGTLDGIDTTNRWIRVNKNGQSLTVGVNLILTFEINTGFTNTTTGAFQVNTSTSSAFTTNTDRTLGRVIKAYVASEVVNVILDFILPTTEEYFRVRYNGNATWSFVAGSANAYLSRYSVRTYL